VPDEIPHDEEVSGEAHLDDDRDLDFQALLVDGAIEGLFESRELLEPMAQTFARDVGEVAGRLEALRHLEIGEHGAAEVELETAAHLGDP
jgi:hypothetical protein